MNQLKTMTSHYELIDVCIDKYSESKNFYLPFELRNIIQKYIYEPITDKNIHSAVKL